VRNRVGVPEGVKLQLGKAGLRYALFLHRRFELPGDDFLHGLHLELFEDAFGLEKIIQAAADSGIALLAHDLFSSFMRFLTSFNSDSGTTEAPEGALASASQAVRMRMQLGAPNKPR
jgi:hypothetical protein